MEATVVTRMQQLNKVDFGSSSALCTLWTNSVMRKPWRLRRRPPPSFLSPEDARSLRHTCKALYAVCPPTKLFVDILADTQPATLKATAIPALALPHLREVDLHIDCHLGQTGRSLRSELWSAGHLRGLGLERAPAACKVTVFAQVRPDVNVADLRALLVAAHLWPRVGRLQLMTAAWAGPPVDLDHVELCASVESVPSALHCCSQAGIRKLRILGGTFATPDELDHLAQLVAKLSERAERPGLQSVAILNCDAEQAQGAIWAAALRRLRLVHVGTLELEYFHLREVCDILGPAALHGVSGLRLNVPEVATPVPEVLAQLAAAAQSMANLRALDMRLRYTSQEALRAGAAASTLGPHMLAPLEQLSLSAEPVNRAARVWPGEQDMMRSAAAALALVPNLREARLVGLGWPGARATLAHLHTLQLENPQAGGRVVGVALPPDAFTGCPCLARLALHGFDCTGGLEAPMLEVVALRVEVGSRLGALAGAALERLAASLAALLATPTRLPGLSAVALSLFGVTHSEDLPEAIRRYLPDVSPAFVEAEARALVQACQPALARAAARWRVSTGLARQALPAPLQALALPGAAHVDSDLSGYPSSCLLAELRD